MVQARTDARFLRDMLVALQLIDDLRNALVSVGTDQLLVVGVGPGGAITVTATDLDIRNLTKAQDELYAVLRTDAGAVYDARQAQIQLPATAPLTTPLSGQTPVPGAGVRVQLPNRPCIAASIKALPSNAGNIYLGDNTVAAANGHVLAASDAVNVAIDNLDRFWIDADNNGEGVSHLVVS